MGRLHTIGKIVIRVYANDHLPPHFHVIAPDYEALVEIATLAIYAGSMDKRDTKKVMAWVNANRDLIAAEWNRCNTIRI